MDIRATARNQALILAGPAPRPSVNRDVYLRESQAYRSRVAKFTNILAQELEAQQAIQNNAPQVMQEPVYFPPPQPVTPPLTPKPADIYYPPPQPVTPPDSGQMVPEPDPFTLQQAYSQNPDFPTVQARPLGADDTPKKETIQPVAAGFGLDKNLLYLLGAVVVVAIVYRFAIKK